MAINPFEPEAPGSGQHAAAASYEAPAGFTGDSMPKDMGQLDAEAIQRNSHTGPQLSPEEMDMAMADIRNKVMQGAQNNLVADEILAQIPPSMQQLAAQEIQRSHPHPDETAKQRDDRIAEEQRMIANAIGGLAGVAALGAGAAAMGFAGDDEMTMASDAPAMAAPAVASTALASQMMANDIALETQQGQAQAAQEAATKAAEGQQQQQASKYSLSAMLGALVEWFDGIKEKMVAALSPESHQAVRAEGLALADNNVRAIEHTPRERLSDLSPVAGLGATRKAELSV